MIRVGGRRTEESVFIENIHLNKEFFLERSDKQLRNYLNDKEISSVFDRADQMKNQCGFGKQGICCRACYMGPCRITTKTPKGICGANQDTIVARNYVREICGGVAAHSDHGRELVRVVGNIVKSKGGQYRIKGIDEFKKLYHFYLGIDLGDKEITTEEIGKLTEKFEKEYGDFASPLMTAENAPLKTRQMWKSLEIYPKGIDASITEMIHRTTMGVDHDYKNLILGGFRAALADGWGGSMLATNISDLLFGTPMPIRSQVNLGVLKKDHVNIVVHGHEPAFTEMIVLASQDPKLIKYANEMGAVGIQLAGICCTANEVLMRKGVPVAGTLLQQELAIATGLVEAMTVDVQCVMPALSELSKCFHTKFIATSHIAKTPEMISMTYSHDDAYEGAKEIIKLAIENYKNRNERCINPCEQKMDLVAGFSNKAIFHMLGGKFRNTFRPLNDAIISGRIRGIVGVVGCSNPKIETDSRTLPITKELIKNDILVVETGCAAISCAKQGLMTPEVALELAGDGLKEVCQAVGIPPVLHMGSCVDNSRILMAMVHILNEGGLGESISDLPVAGSAPEWMSEKAVAIGSYFVASGVYTVLGHPLATSGSQKVTNFLCDEVEEMTGGKFAYIEDPSEAVDSIVKHIEKKRDALGINKKIERKLFDMKDRRENV